MKNMFFLIRILLVSTLLFSKISVNGQNEWQKVGQIQESLGDVFGDQWQFKNLDIDDNDNICFITDDVNDEHNRSAYFSTDLGKNWKKYRFPFEYWDGVSSLDADPEKVYSDGKGFYLLEHGERTGFYTENLGVDWEVLDLSKEGCPWERGFILDLTRRIIHRYDINPQTQEDEHHNIIYKKVDDQWEIEYEGLAHQYGYKYFSNAFFKDIRIGEKEHLLGAIIGTPYENLHGAEINNQMTNYYTAGLGHPIYRVMDHFSNNRNYPEVMVSNDMGKTWEIRVDKKMHGYNVERLFRMKCPEQLVCLLSSLGNAPSEIGISYNGGRSWKKIGLPGMSTLIEGFFYLSDDHLLVIDSNGEIFRSIKSINSICN